MSSHGRRLIVVLLWLAVACGARLAWAARQPAKGPTQALQKLAERQGHPQAAVRDLRNFGHEVPLEMEAAAAGIAPEALRRAIEQGGPLTAQLETAQGKRLSEDQTGRIGEAERQYARQLEPLRKTLVDDVVAVTGLPEARVCRIFARDQGTPAAEERILARLERALGRQLTAGDAKRVGAARERFRTASQSPRNALAREVAKIAGLPSSIVLALMR